MYQQLPNSQLTGQPVQVIKRLSDNACIPFDPNNTDFAKFKRQILANESQLQDADGVTMTAAEAKAFVATLP
jgi:hypothetical protein